MRAHRGGVPAIRPRCRGRPAYGIIAPDAPASPILIVVIGVLALIVVFFPGLRIPAVGDPTGGTRLLETKLGLDLQGGFRVEYQALPKDGRTPESATSRRSATSSSGA